MVLLLGRSCLVLPSFGATQAGRRRWQSLPHDPAAATPSLLAATLEGGMQRAAVAASKHHGCGSCWSCEMMAAQVRAGGARMLLSAGSAWLPVPSPAPLRCSTRCLSLPFPLASCRTAARQRAAGKGSGLRERRILQVGGSRQNDGGANQFSIRLERKTC